jgi:hypothetical protein
MSVTTHASAQREFDGKPQQRVTEQLAGRFKGEVIVPDHPGYQQDGYRYYTKEAHLANLADDAIGPLSSSARTCRWRARSRSSASAARSATSPSPTRRSGTAATC